MVEFSKIFFDSFYDTLRIAPLLLAVYIIIELAEFKFGGAIISQVKKAGRLGPLIGALAGIFPQCGFSVIATALYTQRLVTIGALLAVYLSTSDEALPIIMSRPESIGLAMPLILTKLAIAVGAGYFIDIVFAKKNRKVLAHIADYAQGRDNKNHHHETAAETKACCGHSADAAAKRFKAAEILLHPLVHTAKISFFIFTVSLAIGYLLETAGAGILAAFFGKNALWAPLATAIVGLIPNCAASVAITEFYLDGIIGRGAAISGLCSSAGLGILLLLKEEKNKKEVAVIIGLLLAISAAAGTAIDIAYHYLW